MSGLPLWPPDRHRQQDEREEGRHQRRDAEAQDPRIVGVLAGLQIHDVEAPHPLVDAPEARAPGDDLAARGIDVKMRPVAHPDLPRGDWPAQVERRPGRVGAGDADHLGLAGGAGRDFARRVGGRIAGEQAPARRIGEAAAAIGEAEHPARPRRARFDRQALEAAALNARSDWRSCKLETAPDRREAGPAHLLDRLHTMIDARTASRTASARR